MVGKHTLPFGVREEKSGARFPVLCATMVTAAPRDPGREGKVANRRPEEDVLRPSKMRVRSAASNGIAFSSLRKSLSRARLVTREKGVVHVVRSAAGIVRHRVSLQACYTYHRLFRSRRSFTFKGRTYRYFYHPYNRTWSNERTVEIPLIRRMLEENRGRQVLEVGNVLSHYFEVSHDIVDKYERSEGVMNLDVVDYQPDKKYDLIVSVSTIEHIGWDEDLRDKPNTLDEPPKVLQAVGRMKECLADGGVIVVTFPIGYNPQLDRVVTDGKLHFKEMHCMRRVSKANTWVEASWDEVKNSVYGKPYLAANGLLVCFADGD